MDDRLLGDILVWNTVAFLVAGYFSFNATNGKPPKWALWTTKVCVYVWLACIVTALAF